MEGLRLSRRNRACHIPGDHDPWLQAIGFVREFIGDSHRILFSELEYPRNHSRKKQLRWRVSARALD
jgi:hypothetical protein